MTLLSFTSAMKYVLGLMLAMLGFIPYESLETNQESYSEPKQDTMTVTCITEPKIIQANQNFQVYFNETRTLLDSEMILLNVSDSIEYFIVKQISDTAVSVNDLIISFEQQ